MGDVFVADTVARYAENVEAAVLDASDAADLDATLAEFDGQSADDIAARLAEEIDALRGSGDERL